MPIRPLLPLALLATLALASCEKDNAPSPTQLTLLATRWQLVRVDSLPVTAASYSGTQRAYLEFIDLGQCTVGLGPCNNFSGRFSLAGGGQRLHIAPPIPTRATCPLQALETQYLGNLARTSHYEISGSELRLYDAATAAPRLVFWRAE